MQIDKTGDEFTTDICYQLFETLGLDKINDYTEDKWIENCQNSDFIYFVNQLFLYWTGTFTCFMLEKF